ncbi:unnamed protein product [Effrenium voratum]|nr:unnamed protein product [Effrenium voratum]
MSSRTYGSAAMAVACAGAGAFLIPGQGVGGAVAPRGHAGPKAEATGATLSVAAPLALGTAAVAVACKRRTQTRAVQQRAPLLNGLEDAIQSRLEERLKRQHKIASEMQRNNDAFKKQLEEELASHMGLKDQLKTRIRALQARVLLDIEQLIVKLMAQRADAAPPVQIAISHELEETRNVSCSSNGLEVTAVPEGLTKAVSSERFTALVPLPQPELPNRLDTDIESRFSRQISFYPGPESDSGSEVLPATCFGTARAEPNSSACCGFATREVVREVPDEVAPGLCMPCFHADSARLCHGALLAFDPAGSADLLFKLLFWAVTLPIPCRHGATSIAVLDAVLVGLLCFELLSGISFLRGFQLLRVLRLVQLFKFTGFGRPASRWMHQSGREVRALVNIAATLCLTAIFLHVLTCVWFSCGSLANGWVDEEVRQLSLRQQYQRSLELALSRLHPSRTAENMTMNTQLERMLSLLATGAAVLCGAIFTSIVTNDLSDIRRTRREQREAQNKVSDFLTIYPVSWELELQMKEYLNRNMCKVKMPCKQDLSHMLPDFLFRELCREALTPVWAKHSFLHGLMMRHLSFQYDLSTQCLMDWNVGADETLFSAGSKCDSMLMLSHGSIEYRAMGGCKVLPHLSRQTSFQQPLSKEAEGDPDAVLHPGDWLAEACLWVSWQFMGKARSHGRSALICLSYPKLLAAVNLHKEASFDLILYARHFVATLNDIPEEELTDLPINVDLPDVLS